MKRFVSYLYSIYNNQKIHNSGFARIELRTGRNRIDIHLQEGGYSGKTGTVYLFVRKKENIQGISIGNITFRNSQADFRYEQPEENIGQTSWQIMQMNGIVILIDGQITFLSQWDEKPVDTLRFEVWSQEKEEKEMAEEQRGQKGEGKEMAEEKRGQKEAGKEMAEEQGGQKRAGKEMAEEQGEQRRERKEMAEEQGGQKGEEKAGGKMEAESRSENATANRNATANPQFMQNTGNSPGRPYATNYSQIQNTPRIHNIQNTAESLQPGWNARDEENSQADSVQPSSIHTAEIQPQPGIHQWEQTWRYMLRRYPVLNQFADKDNALCVRIEIKDVRLLPEKYWSVVNNSFLLHGFFNYRYLIFGRIGQNWIIGIPGIYQNQEHAMASIFGFPDFLPQMQKNERGEQPGYWYRILEI